MGIAIARNLRKTTFSERMANRLFIFLGIASYAALFPLGLLLVKTGDFVPNIAELVAASRLARAAELGNGSPFLKTLLEKKTYRDTNGWDRCGRIGCYYHARGDRLGMATSGSSTSDSMCQCVGLCFGCMAVQNPASQSCYEPVRYDRLARWVSLDERQCFLEIGRGRISRQSCPFRR